MSTKLTITEVKRKLPKPLHGACASALKKGVKKKKSQVKERSNQGRFEDLLSALSDGAKPI